MISSLQYFGTEPDRAGHQFWRLEGSSLSRSRLSYNDCPFNPEGLPYKKGHDFRNGETEFYQFAGFSIYAIEGSCYDTRPASRSVFFIEKEMSKEELKALILSTDIGKRIIEKMPFAVQW